MEKQFEKSTETPEDEPVSALQSYVEYHSSNPCEDCNAPCCNMFILPYPTPFTFMHLDYMRFLVGFEGVTMLLNADGTWQLKVEKRCYHFDEATGRCAIHDISLRPKTCVFFNPSNCFYKRNFTTGNPSDVAILDQAALDQFIDHLKFNNNGEIVETIGVQDVRALLAQT